MVYNKQFSYTDLTHMPYRIFHTLYSRARKKLSTDEGRNEIAGNKLKDVMEEGVKG